MSTSGIFRAFPANPAHVNNVVGHVGNAAWSDEELSAPLHISPQNDVVEARRIAAARELEEAQRAFAAAASQVISPTYAQVVQGHATARISCDAYKEKSRPASAVLSPVLAETPRHGAGGLTLPTHLAKLGAGKSPTPPGSPKTLWNSSDAVPRMPQAFTALANLPTPEETPPVSPKAQATVPNIALPPPTLPSPTRAEPKAAPIAAQSAVRQAREARPGRITLPEKRSAIPLKSFAIPKRIRGCSNRLIKRQLGVGPKPPLPVIPESGRSASVSTETLQPPVLGLLHTRVRHNER